MLKNVEQSNMLYMRDLEVKYSKATSKIKEEKSIPPQSLLSTENKNKNKINRIPHWIFYLFTLNERSIFLSLINVIRKRSDSWFGLKKQRRNNAHAQVAKRLNLLINARKILLVKEDKSLNDQRFSNTKWYPLGHIR